MNMMALTHAVSAELERCELVHHQREPIDLELARAQHSAYVALLRRHGLQVIELSVNRKYPDSVFVEDSAVVVDELAVLTRPGAVSRRGEVAGIGAALDRYRTTVQIESPATLDGGDVLRIGRRVYVGSSTRSNPAGHAALRHLLQPHGYSVKTVPLAACLHLKSAVTALDERTLLHNPDWVATTHFPEYELIPVAAGEPGAANALRIADTVFLPASYPRTAATVRAAGFIVETVDISELQKAEAGLTCSSLIFPAEV
ncbi:MAG: arginine deiminase-related protein [bacterium]